MIDALRRRLELEYDKAPEIWSLFIDKEHKGTGRKPVRLTDEQIEFITELFHDQLLSLSMVSMLYGYKKGSAGFKRIVDRYEIDYSSEQLEQRRLAHRKQLTTIIEPVLHKSKGHIWITDYCKLQGWEYIEEWSGFSGNLCVNPKTGKLLKFDVYIPELNLVVEYHGRQHYSADNWYHQTTADKSDISQEKAFDIYTQRDDFKYQWTVQNDLQYLEISHTLFDNNYPLQSIFAPFLK